MFSCFFVSDLHGKVSRYRELFAVIARERPAAVFIGGDFSPLTRSLSPSPDFAAEDFFNGFLLESFLRLQEELRDAYPQIFLIMGNDDCRAEEPTILAAATRGVWQYIHNRRVNFKGFDVYGYSYVPPTPFWLKDWERYDVSRYIDPGAVSPEEGLRSVPVRAEEIKYATIQDDLDRLTGKADLSRAIFLFHSPPYQTKLDLSTLEPKMVDYVPLDRHLGSIAVRRFIEARQPLLTLHGHIHEAARVSYSWRDVIGRTICFSAAYDGPELALIRFDLECPESATRELI